MSKAQSRWLLVTVLLVISLAMAAFAGGEPRTNVPPGGLWVYNTASDTWVPVAADSNGYLRTVTGTTTITLPDPVVMDDKYGYVTGTQFDEPVDMATNTVKFFSEIASFTPPCEIEFQFQGDVFIGPATTTVASARSRKFVEDSHYSVKVATTTWNCGIVADTATCPVGIAIHTLGR